jgi:mannan endo-1,4-beta-mannosidase
VGVNNYDLTGAHTGSAVSAADADAFFAQLPPHSMVRVWAFEEWGLPAVTQTVRLAEKYNQKVILALADGSTESGRSPKWTLAWYQGGYKSPFYDAAWGKNVNYWNWVSTAVTAFKASPAVAIWELMNEPGSGSIVSNITTTDIKQFFDTNAAHIKQLDPIHLVSTGSGGPWQTFQAGADGYAQVHSGPDIDLVSVHEYDYPYSNGVTLGSYQFDTAAQAARALGKPIYVGESGISLANGCMTAAQRADVLRQKFDLYLNAGSSGVLYWATMGSPNNPGTICNSEHGNDDPMLGGAIIDTISKYQY